MEIIEMQRKFVAENGSDFEICWNWEVVQIRFLFTFVKWSDLEDIWKFDMSKFKSWSYAGNS